MTITEQIILIAICVLVTMATRFLPFLLFKEGKPIPKYLQFLGKALPTAIFAMLVVYCMRDVSFVSGNYGIPALISIAVVVGLHLWRKNMILSIAAGTILYMILVQLVF